MIQFDLVEYRGTTHKQDEHIVSLVEQLTFVTARDIANKLTKTGATVNERTKQQPNTTDRYQSHGAHQSPLKKWAQGKTKLQTGNR